MGGFQAEEWQIFLKVTLDVMLKWFEGSKVEAIIIVQAWYNGGLGQSSDSKRVLEAVRFVLLFWKQNQWDLQMCHGRERRLLPFVDFYESFRCIFMYVQVDILSFSIYFKVYNATYYDVGIYTFILFKDMYGALLVSHMECIVSM